jgi:hypothetical protein
MAGGVVILAVIFGIGLWISCYGYAMRLTGREVDKVRRAGQLDELWDGFLLKRRLLGTLAVICIVTLVPVEAILLRADSTLIGLAAGLADFGLAPTFVYFGFIHGGNYVHDNPDDREIVQLRRAARRLHRSSK